MITCPQCGTQNLPGMAYCEHCGSPLSAPEPAQPHAAPGEDAAAAAALAQAQSLLHGLDDDGAAPVSAAGAAATPVEEHEAVADPGGLPLHAIPDDTQSAAPAAQPAPTVATDAPVLTITFSDGADYTIRSDVTNVGRSDVAQNWHPELDVIPFGGGAPDFGVSRHQALIQRTGSTFVLIDVGSTNGTFVNGKLLEYNRPAELHDGDTVAFGAFNTKISIR